MKYKSGDKVKVKSLVNGFYNGVYYNSHMSILKGTTLTIKGVYPSRYTVKENGHTWNDAMLEPIICKKPLKYNIGDKVKIREDLIARKWYGSKENLDNTIATYDMMGLKGKVSTICGFGASGTRYRLNGLHSYVFCEEMLERFVEVETEEQQIERICEEFTTNMKKIFKTPKVTEGIILKGIEKDVPTSLIKQFSWEGFKNRGFAVNCNGNHEIINFMRQCDINGVRFTEGEDKSLVDWYNGRIAHQYSNTVAFLINNSKYGGLCHSEKEFFISEGIVVLEYKDIPCMHPLSKFSDIELIQELKRRH
jgi:hypothetical protein